MTTGGYSGNLVRTVQEPDPVERRLPFPHPGHGQDQSDPYPDETQVPAGLGAEYAGSGFPNTMVVGGGVLLDTPPTWGSPEEHDSAAVLYPLESDAQQVALIGREHEGDQDRGWLRSTYKEPPLQSALEVRSDVQRDEFTTQPTNTVPLLRGINSYRENNPDREGYINGFRPGVFRWFTDNIERLRGRIRYYDLQPLTQRDFLIPANTPELDGAPPYGPNFPSWVDGIFHVQVRPQLPRDPGSLDDPMLATPMLESSAVIGGGLSG